MTAYVIALRNELIDPKELETYGQKAVAARIAGMKRLVIYGYAETLEGEPVDGVVMLSFETYEDAQRWYHSPTYQDAKTHRLKGGDYELFLVEGLDA